MIREILCEMTKITKIQYVQAEISYKRQHKDPRQKNQSGFPNYRKILEYYS